MKVHTSVKFIYARLLCFINEPKFLSIFELTYTSIIEQEKITTSLTFSLIRVLKKLTLKMLMWVRTPTVFKKIYRCGKT